MLFGHHDCKEHWRCCIDRRRLETWVAHDLLCPPRPHVNELEETEAPCPSIFPVAGLTQESSYYTLVCAVLEFKWDL